MGCTEIMSCWGAGPRIDSSDRQPAGRELRQFPSRLRRVPWVSAADRGVEAQIHGRFGEGPRVTYHERWHEVRVAHRDLESCGRGNQNAAVMLIPKTPPARPAPPKPKDFPLQ